MRHRARILIAVAVLAFPVSAAIWAVEPPRPAIGPAAPAIEPIQPVAGAPARPGLIPGPSLFTFRVPVRLQAIVEGTRAEVRCDVRKEGMTLAAGAQEVPLNPYGFYSGVVSVATSPMHGVTDLSLANNYYCWLILQSGASGHAACPASVADCPPYARIKPSTSSRTGVSGSL